jgi:glycosyltransferase involved in cell wall biosynthesis
MRVLQFSTSFPESGGIQTHIMDLSRWLETRDHTVRLAGEPGETANSKTHPDFLELPMNQISREEGRLGPRLLALFRAALKLRRELRKSRVDIVHAHETAPSLTAWLATLGMGIPIVMTFHGSAPERVAQVARVARLTADLTLSPSQTSLDALISVGLDQNRAMRLGLGVKPSDAPPADAVASLRREYLGERQGPIIFSTSRLHHQKGIDIMLSVAAIVRSRYPSAVFFVAGAGPLNGVVQQWARDAGLQDSVRFLGSIDTVPLHLAACDLFLLTSRWENLPISIVEAFRAGRPVIATDCGGVRELVDESVGALCQVGDVAALADAILELLDDPELARKKGKAALKRSTESRFDPDAVHSEYERVYAGILGKSRHRNKDDTKNTKPRI